jgi:Phosphoinositide phospholipase C, Ca2+-dependent
MGYPLIDRRNVVNIRRLLPAAVLTAALIVVSTIVVGAGPAAAAVDPAQLPESGSTVVGVHNTYDPATYAFLADALDQRPGLIELDVWPDVLTREWKVSHDNPFGNANNCVAATSAANLHTGGTNKNLEFCLDDIRLWLGAHPTAGPLILKLELKTGFSGRTGQGPAQLDAAIHTHLGGAVFRPVDLRGGFASLDAAAVAGAWPTRAALAGKVIVEVIPGTVEEGNPTDTLKTDVEYAQYLGGLAANGTLAQAQIFPSVHNAQSGDPRTRYADTTLRPWFVVFDGDATAFVTGSIDTSWYDTHHYLLIMTDAQNVPPTVAAGDRTAIDARIALLAHDHASVVSSDWSSTPAALSEVLTRG